uniref:Protein kinase domain-containing protein n=1 Tax=Panagrolaimus sp. JU765 TaxID=591449 RepID=A0AC34RCX7_9BILA
MSKENASCSSRVQKGQPLKKKLPGKNDDPNGSSISIKRKKAQSARPAEKKGGSPGGDPEKSQKKVIAKKVIKLPSPGVEQRRGSEMRPPDRRCSEKQVRASVKEVRPRPAKTISPKYDLDPKLIETPNVKREMLDESKSEKELPKEELLANPESIRLGRKKCIHMWPTPSDIAKLKDTPRPWSYPKIRQTQNLEYFVGRLPQWYIEEKFLRFPGDFCISRDAMFRYILSVKTKEPGNPCAHFVIEFVETQLVRNDRNFYHRIVGTILQSNTVQGLIQKYRESIVPLLKENLKRDAELLNPVPPCLGCIYSKQEYNYHYLFVRKAEDVKTGALLSKGEGYRLFKGTRIIRIPTTTDQVIVRNVVIREYDSQTMETLDFIVREMHIVQTIRYKIGWNTVVNVEGICTVQKPFHILYRVCSEGCLSQYLTAKKDVILEKDKIALLRKIALILHRVYRLGFLHCDICVKNIYVHIDDDIPIDVTKLLEPKKVHILIGCWKTAVMNKTKKFDSEKFAMISIRYLAPEVFETKELNETTEVYAFGLLIYETMLQEKPWKGLPDLEIKKLLQEGKMLQLVLPPNVPVSLQNLIKNCMDPDPKKRPTMRQVATSLKEMIHEKPNNMNLLSDTSMAQPISQSPKPETVKKVDGIRKSKEEIKKSKEEIKKHSKEDANKKPGGKEEGKKSKEEIKKPSKEDANKKPSKEDSKKIKEEKKVASKENVKKGNKKSLPSKEEIKK